MFDQFRLWFVEEVVFWENRKCTKWLQNDLECYKAKDTPCTLIYCHSATAVFQISEDFGFFIENSG